MKDVTGKVWTTVGNAVLVDTGKFGKCLSLPAGAGGYLTTPGHEDFLFRLLPFTMECWIKTTQTGEKYVIDAWPTTGDGRSWQLGMKDNHAYFAWNDPRGSAHLEGTSVVNDDKWHHIAIVRAGTGGNTSPARLFVDGKKEAEASMDGNNFDYMMSVLGIGAQVARRNNAYDFTGLIDEVRIVKGRAVYWLNFVPQRGPFAQAESQAIISSLSFDVSVTEDEAAAPGVWLNTTDNAQLDTAEKKAGASSLTFARFAKGAVKAADGPRRDMRDFYDRTKPHTLECWFKVDPVKLTAYEASGSTSAPLIHCSNGGGNSDMFLFIRNEDKKLAYYNGPEGSLSKTGGDTYVADQWNHAAFDFDGTACRIFMNGKMAASWPADHGWRFDYTQETRIGMAYVDGYGGYSSAFPGWIDGVQITAGSKYGSDDPFVPQ